MPRRIWQHCRLQILLSSQHLISWRRPPEYRQRWCSDQLLVGRDQQCSRPRFCHEPGSELNSLGCDPQKHPKCLVSWLVHEEVQGSGRRHGQRPLGGVARLQPWGQQKAESTPSSTDQVCQPRGCELHQVWAPRVLGKWRRPSVFCTYLSWKVIEPKVQKNVVCRVCTTVDIDNDKPRIQK